MKIIMSTRKLIMQKCTLTSFNLKVLFPVIQFYFHLQVWWPFYRVQIIHILLLFLMSQSHQSLCFSFQTNMTVLWMAALILPKGSTVNRDLLNHNTLPLKSVVEEEELKTRVSALSICILSAFIVLLKSWKCFS